MDNIRTALIACAGWKFGEIQAVAPELDIPYRCPEALFPLADGNTVLSRMVKQLRRYGVKDIYVAVGNPDTYRTLKKEKLVGEQRGYTPPGTPGDTPWTWERVWEVKKIDRHIHVVLIDNPLMCSSEWETVAQLLGCLYGDHRVGNTVFVAGDYIFETAFLHSLFKRAPRGHPSICWVLPVHDIIFLNEYGVRTLWKHIKRFPERCKDQTIMGGGALWVERELLGNQGFEMWEPKEDCKQFAPWVGKGNLGEGDRPLFAELGTKAIEYTAAQFIALDDPIGDIL